MALSDYTPSLMWFADGLSDLDGPTGTTKSNPGALTDPTIAGTGDQYADFDGSNGVAFTPASPVQEVGQGDFTIVMRARIDVFSIGDTLFQNYDGAGTSGVNSGLEIDISSASNENIRLIRPPSSASNSITVPDNTLVAGQDFIVAFRRTSGVCQLWLSADGTTVMAEATPDNNTFGDSNIESCGDVVFGCDRDGNAGIDGRIYWFIGIDASVADADLELSDWLDESNLKAAWVDSGSASVGLLQQMHYYYS